MKLNIEAILKSLKRSPLYFKGLKSKEDNKFKVINGGKKQ